ncbi:ATP-binding protein, partial [Streptomyces albidoflavus]
MSTDLTTVEGSKLGESIPSESRELPSLRLLSFADLTVDIRQSLSSARLPAKKEAWRNLLNLALELKSKSEMRQDPTAGEPWHLTSVTVVGYQGATNQVIMKVDPSPGVTIIHGPNGSG